VHSWLACPDAGFVSRLPRRTEPRLAVDAFPRPVGKYGVRLGVYGVLARYARMVGVVAEATHVRKYGARLWGYGVLARNARMVGVVAEATQEIR